MSILVAVLLFLQDAPPAIVSATAHGDPSKIVVVFTKPVEQSSAETPANYAVDRGIKVEKASRASDLRTVTLTTSPLLENVAYALTVQGIRDCSSPPLTVAVGSGKPFTFTKGLFGGAPK